MDKFLFAKVDYVLSEKCNAVQRSLDSGHGLWPWALARDGVPTSYETVKHE